MLNTKITKQTMLNTKIMNSKEMKWSKKKKRGKKYDKTAECIHSAKYFHKRIKNFAHKE